MEDDMGKLIIRKTAGEYETLLSEVTFKIIRKLDPEALPEKVEELKVAIDKVIKEVLPVQQ
jgi:hypothetical protein